MINSKKYVILILYFFMIARSYLSADIIKIASHVSRSSLSHSYFWLCIAAMKQNILLFGKRFFLAQTAKICEDPAGDFFFTKHVSLKLEWCIDRQRVILFYFFHSLLTFSISLLNSQCSCPFSLPKSIEFFLRFNRFTIRPLFDRQSQIISIILYKFPIKLMRKYTRYISGQCLTLLHPSSSSSLFLFASEKHITLNRTRAKCKEIKMNLLNEGKIEISFQPKSDQRESIIQSKPILRTQRR